MKRWLSCAVRRTSLAWAMRALLLASLTYSSVGGTAPAHAQERRTVERSAAVPERPFRYIETTGHYLAGVFLAYHDEHAATIGDPITEAFIDPESGQQVQYFAYARLTSDPKDLSSPVVATPAGTLLISPADADRPLLHVQRTALPMGGTRLHLRRSLVVAAPFRARLRADAALRAHAGEALAPARFERMDERLRLVQQFERVQFVYYPEQPADMTVQHTPAGVRYVQQLPNGADLLQPLPAMQVLASGVTRFAPGSGDAANIVLAAELLNGTLVPPGATFSYLDEVGPLTPAMGYRDGLGIDGGRIVPMLAGGICQVSSAMFEAALYSGMPIVERHQHSFLLYFFNERPGIEAAVAEGGGGRIDLRWRNVTDHYMYVTTERSGDMVRVLIWGVPDGRTVLIGGPNASDTTDFGERRILDEEMEPGEEEVVTYGAPGMNVTVARQVFAADGSLLFSDAFASRYAATDKVVRHGPEGTETPTPSATPSATPTPNYEREEPTDVPPTATATATSVPVASPTSPIVEPTVAEPVIVREEPPTAVPEPTLAPPPPTAVPAPTLAPLPPTAVPEPTLAPPPPVDEAPLPPVEEVPPVPPAPDTGG